MVNSSFVIRESGREIALSSAKGELLLEVDRSAGRRSVLLSVQITAALEGEEAVFWLKHQGPIKDERLAVQHRVAEGDTGGFYCCEHEPLENLAFVTYRRDQTTWRFVAVADLGLWAGAGPRIEIDLDVAVAAAIDWQIG